MGNYRLMKGELHNELPEHSTQQTTVSFVSKWDKSCSLCLQRALLVPELGLLYLRLVGSIALHLFWKSWSFKNILVSCYYSAFISRFIGSRISKQPSCITTLLHSESSDSWEGSWKGTVLAEGFPCPNLQVNQQRGHMGKGDGGHSVGAWSSLLKKQPLLETNKAKGPLEPYPDERFLSGNSPLHEYSCSHLLGKLHIYPRCGWKTECHRSQLARKGTEYCGSGKYCTHCTTLNATNNIFAIMFNNLTFSRHANPSEISVFAGCSIPSLYH